MTKIYVGNLAHAATQNDLHEAFSQHGNVSEVSIVTDRETGRSRGFAFIEMPDSKEAASAIQALDLVAIHGRSITVNEARPKPDRPRGGPRRKW